ncbi:esterase/lipase family protein [Nocardia sp. NPDC004415]
MTPLPVRYNALAAIRYGRNHVDPPGANRWDIESSGSPVILLHGLGIDMATSWYALSPLLTNLGYDVFALDYGRYGHGMITRPRGTGKVVPGVGDLERCAEELDQFVDEVLATTGAAKVALVGHSVGGLLAQYFLKRRGGDTKVSHFVGLAPTVHGLTFNGLLRAPRLQRIGARLVGENILQQAAGSKFIEHLYTDGETVDGVEYTMISPHWDMITTPIRAQRLEGPATNNIRLRNYVDHVLIVYNKTALEHVVAALDSQRY